MGLAGVTRGCCVNVDVGGNNARMGVGMVGMVGMTRRCCRAVLDEARVSGAISLS